MSILSACNALNDTIEKNVICLHIMNTVRLVWKEHNINIKLIIGNRESGTGNWFLVPYLRKRLGYFKTVKSETGNREPGTGNLFLILVYYTNVSKVQIGNKETVPGSLLTIIGFILVSVFYFINM